MSFNEGNISNSLEISSKERIKFIESSDHLSNSIIDNEKNEFIYRLNFNNRKDLEEFKRKLDNQKKIEKINVLIN